VKHAEQIGGRLRQPAGGLGSGEEARQVKHTEHRVEERNHDSDTLLSREIAPNSKCCILTNINRIAELIRIVPEQTLQGLSLPYKISLCTIWREPFPLIHF
jgi:hypothetical protein